MMMMMMIRYDTRCYFNVRSKADISQLNLPHGSWSRVCCIVRLSVCVLVPVMSHAKRLNRRAVVGVAIIVGVCMGTVMNPRGRVGILWRLSGNALKTR